MDYNNYVHQNQDVGQNTRVQDQDQYLVIHSGGLGISEDGFAALSATSDDAVGNQIQSDRGDLSHLPILTYSGEEFVMYVKEEVEEEEDEEEEVEKEEETEERDEGYDRDDHEDINDILRNVMRVPSIQSLSPTPSEGESPSCMTQRRPLAEKQSHNATASSIQVAMRSNPKLTIRASLPPGFSYMFGKKKRDYISGVITRRVIDKGQCLGPYNGSLIDETAGQDIGSTWELCLRGVVWFYLDGRNTIHNNWLYHISSARTKAEQNLEAFQHYGDIYYRAIENIQPGTELKVFYSDEYREKIGCRVHLDELNYQRDTDDFQCMECNAWYKTSKRMLRHIKFNHKQQWGATTNPQETSCSQSSWGVASASNQLLHLAKEALYKKDAVRTTSESARSKKDMVSKDMPVQVDGLSGDHLNQSIAHSSRSGREAEARKHSKSYSSKQTAMAKKDVVLSKQVDSAASRVECPTCGKTFRNEGMLTSHQLFHRTTIKEFICEVCSEVSKTFQEHIRHQNNHAEHLHPCFLCENKYRYVSSFRRHLKNAHRVKKLREKYFCRLCKETLPNKATVIAHRTVCVPRKRYVSEEEYQWRKEEAEAERRSKAIKSRNQASQGSNYYAKEVATDEEESDDLEPHQSGKGNGSWIGEVEEQRSDEEMGLSNVDNASNIEDSDDADLQVSYRQEDSDKLGKTFDYYDRPRPFRCKYHSCPRRYATRHDLFRHIRTVHKPQAKKKMDLRPYKCEQCPRAFASLKGFNNHKVDHTDAKPFRCEPCFKWFRTAERLSRHNYRMHQDHPKKHECEVCGKKFLEGFALKRHEQRHRGERNFACGICDRTFTAKHCLQTHMVKHTGEKPFACEICGKRFSLNLSLVRHAATHDSFDGANHATDDRRFMRK